MSVREKYETAAELTRRMLDAARAQDWDELGAAGAARDALFAALPEALPQLSAQDGTAIARLIEEMLACHSEINEHAGPWLEHTATLLAAFDRADDVAAAAARTSKPEMR